MTCREIKKRVNHIYKEVHEMEKKEEKKKPPGSFSEVWERSADRRRMQPMISGRKSR